MTSEKKKFTSVTTPVGTAIYPKLNAPDTKFKAEGEYNVKLRLSAEDAQPIIDQYEAELKKYFEDTKAELLKGDAKSKAKGKGLKYAADKPYKPHLDDEGDETGDIVFNIKMPAIVKRKDKPDLVLKPDFFDAGGKKLLKAPEIWGGTRMVVSMQLRPWEMPIGVGLSLRLQAVQIISLSTRGDRDADSYGFGAQEGYEGSDGADEGSSGLEDDSSAEGSTDF